jgi:hypothetical protein
LGLPKPRESHPGDPLKQGALPISVAELSVDDLNRARGVAVECLGFGD